MSSSHAALIIDADSTGLESLVYGFQGAEWRITACPSPETASLLVKASGAEIVVVASRTEHEKTHTLIRQIRSKDAFRTLPVLVLGPEESRDSFKELGEVDLLPLPAFVRDVLTASQMLVSAGGPATQKTGEEPCFATDIAAATTLSLVRTMNGLARSGQLQLERKGRRGEILFHLGELTAAQAGPLQGVAAVQHVLIWNDGALQLHLRPVVRRGQLHQTAEELLEEIDRFQRDFTHAVKFIGLPATVFTTNEGLLLHSTGVVPSEVAPVVRLCDGQRPLSDIIDESPFRVLDTVRILGRLVELGILKRRDPEPAESGERASTPFDEFLATARIVGPATPNASSASAGGTPAPSQESPPPGAQAGRPAEATAPSEASAHQETTMRTRKQTLEMAIPTSLTTAPVSPPAAAEDFAPTPPPVVTNNPIAVSASMAPMPVTPKEPLAAQASGTIELGKSSRKTQPTMRAAVERASVVVNVPQTDAAAAPPSTSPAIPTSTSVVVPESTLVVLPAQAVPTETSAARIAGEMHVTPSRKTARQMPTAARITIQLDASLEPKQEEANSVTQAADAQEIAPRGARITGELQVAPSGKSGRVAGKIEGASSFQIDPALAAEEAPAAVEKPRDRPSGSEPAIETPQKRHQSGHFSPIEKDFFAREADLYKEEATESFADLEDRRAKQAAKDRTGSKNDKRHRK